MYFWPNKEYTQGRPGNELLNFRSLTFYSVSFSLFLLCVWCASYLICVIFSMYFLFFFLFLFFYLLAHFLLSSEV